MRIVNFACKGKSGLGIIKGDGLVSLDGRMPGASGKCLRALLETPDAMAMARLVSASFDADVPLSEITYLPPITAQQKCICVGVNYKNRNAEYKDGSNDFPRPSLFCRFAGSFVGHQCSVVRPFESEQLDYEGEIVLVIGKRGRRIPSEKVGEYIAGATCGNEGTIRDWTKHSKFNATQGKNFQASGSMGPWLVTWDELADKGPLHITTRINQEIRQDDTTANMLHDFGSLINYISTFIELVPGDVIFTGTPTGAGVRFDPPRYLCPGDRIEVSIDGIGTLVNGVMDEKEQ